MRAVRSRKSSFQTGSSASREAIPIGSILVHHGSLAIFVTLLEHAHVPAVINPAACGACESTAIHFTSLLCEGQQAFCSSPVSFDYQLSQWRGHEVLGDVWRCWCRPLNTSRKGRTPRSARSAREQLQRRRRLTGGPGRQQRRGRGPERSRRFPRRAPVGARSATKIGHFAYECLAAKPAPRSKQAGQPACARQQLRAADAKTDETHAAFSYADIEHVSFAAPGEDVLPRCVKPSGSLITLDVTSQRAARALRALVDARASNNFARAQSLAKMANEELDVPRTRLSIRLATGSVVLIDKRMVRVDFHGTDERLAESDGPVEISSAQSCALASRHDPRSNAAESVRDCASKSPDRLDVDQSRRDLAPPSTFGEERTPGCASLQGSPRDARRTRSGAGVLGVRIALDGRGRCREQGDRAVGNTAVGVPVLDDREHCREQEMSDAGASAARVQRPNSRVFCCSNNTRDGAPRVEEPDADDVRRRAMASVTWSGHAREDLARNARCREGNGQGASDSNRWANVESRVHCAEQGATSRGDARYAQGNKNSQKLCPGCEHSSGRRAAHGAQRKQKARERISYSPRGSPAPSDEGTDEVETVSVLTQTETGLATKSLSLSNPPRLSSEVLMLPALSWKKFLKNLRDGEVEQIYLVVDETVTADIRTQMSLQ
ncbi:hypothetical protein PybrP1_006920, partial [[Pythium] brassicae (nom. inval.)]